MADTYEFVYANDWIPSGLAARVINPIVLGENEDIPSIGQLWPRGNDT